METVLIISSIVFLSLSFLFLTLFLVDKKNYKLKINNLNLKVESLSNEKNVLVKKIKDLKDIFKTNRYGCYNGVVNLLSDNDKKNNKNGEQYDYIIYVKEIDRYTNGMSKIELIDIEVIAGYEISNYSWIKEAQTKRFCSVRKTSDIEWLESEESLKELRKEKLNKILNND